MHYFTFEIDQFRGAVAHLTDLQELAYRRLLDWYYDTEQPIPLDTQWVARRLRVETEDLAIVLQDFFEQTPEGWRKRKCDEQIAKYHARAEKNRANGMLGGRRKSTLDKGNNPVGNQSPDKTKPTGNPALRQSAISNQESDIPPTPKGVDRFPDFWKVWPAGDRKQDKKKCLEKWRKQKLDEQADAIIADVVAKCQTKKWREGYIEAPLVYLGGQRWLDGGDAVQAPPWWDSQSGIRAQGDRLGVPYENHMASGNSWLRYVAAVWVAAGDGPWWQSNDNVRPIALALNPTDVTKEYEHAIAN